MCRFCRIRAVNGCELSWRNRQLVGYLLEVGAAHDTQGDFGFRVRKIVELTQQCWGGLGFVLWVNDQHQGGRIAQCFVGCGPVKWQYVNDVGPFAGGSFAEKRSTVANIGVFVEGGVEGAVEPSFGVVFVGAMRPDRMMHVASPNDSFGCGVEMDDPASRLDDDDSMADRLDRAEKVGSALGRVREFVLCAQRLSQMWH